MPLDLEAFAKVASPIFTLIVGALIKRYTERHPKLLSFLGHVSAFTLQDEQKTAVFTHAVVVRNAGRIAAKNVRLGHMNLPQNVRLEPQVEHSISRHPDGTGEIVIPVLVPKEQVTISYLYFPPLTWNQINAYTKSDDGFARIINVIPTPQPPKPVVWLVWALMFVGASVLVYWAVRLAAYVI